MPTKRIDIMIEEEKENLEDKIKRAQDAGAIKEIRTACGNMIYDNVDIAEMALALLAGIIDIFPSKRFKEIPELEAVYQKLENGEVKRNILTEKFSVLTLCKEDMKEEFEASPKIQLEIEQFTDEKMVNIAKDIELLLLEEGYWAALREAVEKEVSE